MYVETKILGEKVVISDAYMDVSQLFGSRTRVAPKIYAYKTRNCNLSCMS